MPVSAAKKAANYKWDRANRKNVSCMVPVAVADEFRALCELNGTSMHQVLKAAIEQYIADHKAGE